MGRNKAPSENTVRMLCSKSAGMCEFEGCNKRLFFDGITLSKFNNAYADRAEKYRKKVKVIRIFARSEKSAFPMPLSLRTGST